MAKTKNQNQFSYNNFIKFMNDHFSLIIIILIVLVLGFIAGSLWTENQMLKSAGITGENDQAINEEKPIEESFALENIPDINESDHVIGAEKADVVMISYLDFQCPYCQQWHSTFNDLLEKYNEQITFVYRHFTLGFSYSEKLAQASECVADVGGEEAFWKFTNTLYEKLLDKSIYTLEGGNSIITDSSILTIAANSGASLTQVQSCLENQGTANVLEEMKAGALSAGIGGTPATIIISEKAGREIIPGALSVEEVEALLEKHL